MNPGADLADVLIPGGEVERRVGELGNTIAKVYAAEGRIPLLVGVLKGSTPFLADLVRALDIDVEVDFMSISAYQSSDAQSGVVKIIKDLDSSVADRDVLIVEDIVDTGLTLNYLRKALAQRRPRSVRAVTLLDKSARRIVPVALEYRGFEIPDVFVVGYGLDFQGCYRNAPAVFAVRDMARLAAQPQLLAASIWPNS